MSEHLDGLRDDRMRGEMLKLVRTRHKAQQSRMDHVELWHLMRGVGLDIGENDVITFLQDLAALDLIQFDEEKNRYTNRTSILRIQVCARGLRVLERKIVEETVLI
jgi:hypothetical protein